MPIAKAIGAPPREFLERRSGSGRIHGSLAGSGRSSVAPATTHGSVGGCLNAKKFTWNQDAQAPTYVKESVRDSSLSDPDAGTTSFACDGFGDEISRMVGREQTISGYDLLGRLTQTNHAEMPELPEEFGFTVHIRSRGEEAKEIKKEAGHRAQRWIVERSHRWMNRFRDVLIRWAKRADTYIALLHFACSFITWLAAGLLR